MDEYRKEEDSEEYFPDGTVHEDEFFYTGDYNFVWASREGDPNRWEAWCRGAEFHLDALNQSFRFTLPEAKILLLEDPEQLIGSILGNRRSRWS